MAKHTATNKTADPHAVARRVGIAVVHALQDGADAETMQALQAREARALNALPKQPGYTPTLSPVYAPPVKKTRRPRAAEPVVEDEQPRKTRQPKQQRSTSRQPTRTRRHTPLAPTLGDLMPLL